MFTSFRGFDLAPRQARIKKIKCLTAVNNSPMGNVRAFEALVSALGGRLAIEIQDAAPLTPETYYDKIFAGVRDFTGIMLTTFVEDELAMDDEGRTVYARHDAASAANATVRAMRRAAQRRMESVQ